MDCAKKWSEKDIARAKNLVKFSLKMKVYDSMTGTEAYVYGKSIEWLNDLILVMENEPIKFDQFKPKEEKDKPARIVGGAKDANTSSGRARNRGNDLPKKIPKASKKSKPKKSTRKKAGDKTITNRKMGLSI